MAYDPDLSFVYLGPTRIMFGPGTSKDVGVEMGSLGCKKAFLLTDKNLLKAGLLEDILKALGNKCVGVFSDIPQDTGLDVIDRAATIAKEKGADIVVSVGGGSVMDTAKCVCIVLTEGGSIADFNGIQMLTRLQTPHIAVPTTSGTGCEVTWVAVVMDKKKGQKRLVVETFNAPRIALLDPKLTVKLPPLLTASTGMDAMTHAVECMTSMQREPIADGLAMHAIRLLYKYLPTCVENGSDLVARGQVQIAATIAGWAFGNTMVGIVHAMAHSIGAVAHVPHGIANGILLPHCMQFNFDDAVEQYAMVAEAFGIRPKGMGDREAAQAAIEEMKSFTKRIRHPQKFSEVTVTQDDLVKAATMSMYDGAIVTNPRYVGDSAEVLALYKKAF